MRFLEQFNNVLVYVLLAAGFIKLMMGLWLDASIILAVVVINGLLGFLQEGRAEKSLDSIRNMLSAEARTLRNGQTAMIPAETARAGRHRVPRIRRQDPRRHPPHRRQEPAHGRSGAHRRVGAVGQIDRARLGQGDRRRSRWHGLFRHAGRFRPGDRNGRRDGKPNRTGPHQPVARRRQRARDAALAPDQEVWLRDHDHHPDHQRDHLRLWAFDPRHSVRRNVPGGHGHRRVDDPGRTAGAHHHHARDRRPADGGPQRHRAAPAGGRDARIGGAHLLGQDRHADADGNDGRVRGDRRRYAESHGRRLRQRRPGAQGRRARRQGPGARASGARLGALQRRRAAQRGRRLEGGGRSDRGRALSVRRKTWSQARRRAGRLSAHRRHPVRIRTPVHGDFAQDPGRRRDPARQGRARGDPRPLRSPAGRGWPEAARSRLFRAGLGRPRGPRRARAGAGVAARSRRQSREAWARPICRRILFCWASSASSIRRARKRSRR